MTIISKRSRLLITLETTTIVKLAHGSSKHLKEDVLGLNFWILIKSKAVAVDMIGSRCIMAVVIALLS